MVNAALVHGEVEDAREEVAREVGGVNNEKR